MNNLNGFLPLLGSLVLMLGAITLAQYKPQYKKLLPGILLTLGMLGTFFGISYGLLKVDFLDTTSIPALLVGMKTAFWSSVVGMVFSLFFRFKNNWATSVWSLGQLLLSPWL